MKEPRFLKSDQITLSVHNKATKCVVHTDNRVPQVGAFPQYWNRGVPDFKTPKPLREYPTVTW